LLQSKKALNNVILVFPFAWRSCFQYTVIVPYNLQKSYDALIAAIRRCTTLPAQTLGLENKGVLRVGADADLVIFDPDLIEDRAGYLWLGTRDGITRIPPDREWMSR